MSSVPVSPPLDCSLLFNDLINFRMQNNPTLPMLVYADDQASEHHVTEITFLEFGRAAHRIAHTLRPGRGGDEGQVVMLIANCDTILFHAVVAGMTIAGLVPFLVSYRNSAAAVVDMMKKTNCSRIVTLHHAHNRLIQNICEENAGRKLVVDELPTLSYAFPKLGNEVEAGPFVPYPAPMSRPDLDSPAIYLHSSGSTGFPKPIPHSHRVQILSWLVTPLMQFLKNLPVSSRFGTMTLPAFHAYGMAVQLYVPIASLATAIVYAPRAVTDPHAAPVIPTTDNALDCVRWTKCKILMTVPTFLEQWAVSQENLEELKKLEFILYGGGPLAEKIGNDICAAGVLVISCYGGTEFGCPTDIRSKEDIKDGDWSWMCFADNVKVKWVPYGDDVYECQLLSSENKPLAVENLPDVKGYGTSDLFIKHPTKNLWKIVGRADDVIILASGEKTVPAPMENIITSSPLLQGAVMFGRERNQVGIIVEPHAEHAVEVRDDNAVAAFRNKIWPLVDEANKTAPAFSRIFKKMILITTPEKPILRTPKGSIQKKVTIKAYGAEIDALYDAVESASQSNGLAGPLVWTADVLEGWLMEHANAISCGHSIKASTDLFAQGFDSLSVAYLRNQLVNALRTSPDYKIRNAVSRISLNIIFENPTIELLAARIASIVDESGASQNLDPRQHHIAAINAMIDKYSTGLSRPAVSASGTLQNGTNPAQAVVLLTGSTGGLGSFLLAQLIENPTVERVYAFNRPASTSSAERQRSSFVDKGLSVDLLKSDKLVYIEADASQDKCGLSPALYEEFRGAITMIIHNAWRLDFNLSLGSFEPSVKATRNLVDLALDSRYGRSLRFVFTSSVGSAQSWDRERGPFPEDVQFDPSVAVGSGYGESKYVCERIIVKSGLRVTSLRIGQIAGGPNGSWATTDWVPIIVKSSIALGAFPNSYGVVSWMRASDVAGSVLDVAFAEDVPEALNIVNPQRPPWAEIMSCIRDAVLKQKSASLTSQHLTMVPFIDWVVLLEKRADRATAEDLANIPAIKILEFFRAMARYEDLAQTETQLKEPLRMREAGGMGDFSTTKVQRVSDTVAHMKPVGNVDAQAWVNYWSSAGLF
ncbi:acetyl-CoA synthetase-like protein [Butyriboletus roseoflavus]|nr:acetyl-CoA synthetase-like protein [Butyriboletus roseoflavus]